MWPFKELKRQQQQQHTRYNARLMLPRSNLVFFLLVGSSRMMILLIILHYYTIFFRPDSRGSGACVHTAQLFPFTLLSKAFNMKHVYWALGAFKHSSPCCLRTKCNHFTTLFCVVMLSTVEDHENWYFSVLLRLLIHFIKHESCKF